MISKLEASTETAKKGSGESIKLQLREVSGLKGGHLVGFNVIIKVSVVCSTFASKSSSRNGCSRSWNCLGMVRL
jgi:hypothetical protein